MRKRGINVAVSNQGISGDTTAGMLNRLDSAVPDGTRVVIFDSPAANDGNNGKKAHSGVIDHDGNVRTIIERLRARGIAVVALGPATDAPIAESAGASYCGRLYQGVAQEDLAGPRAGMIHPNPKGHAAIAARILPCAMRALGKKG